MIDEAVAPFAADPLLEMSTLRRRIDDDADLHNPNVTKVVVDRDGFALYFSRAPIPFMRAGQPAGARRGATSGSTSTGATACCGWRVWRRRSSNASEALEQLRALEHGIRIKAMETAPRLDRRRHAGGSRAGRDRRSKQQRWRAGVDRR